MVLLTLVKCMERSAEWHFLTASDKKLRKQYGAPPLNVTMHHMYIEPLAIQNADSTVLSELLSTQADKSDLAETEKCLVPTSYHSTMTTTLRARALLKTPIVPSGVLIKMTSNGDRWDFTLSKRRMRSRLITFQAPRRLKLPLSQPLDHFWGDHKAIMRWEWDNFKQTRNFMVK